MSVSVSTLVRLTRQRLHEANNSPIGAMPSGTDNTPWVTAENGIIEALNRVAAEVCRTCFYYEAEGSITTSARRFHLSDLSSVTPANTILWRAIWINYPAGALRYMSAGVEPITAAFSDTAAAPKYWLDGGEGVVVISPKPDTSYEFVVRGAAVPPVLSSGGPDANFMPDELLQKLLPAGAASRLAMTEADNPAIAARGPLWQAEYDLERVRLWERTPLLIRNRLYPTPPGGMV